jgi:hypothetical protein
MQIPQTNHKIEKLFDGYQSGVVGFTYFVGPPQDCDLRSGLSF